MGCDYFENIYLKYKYSFKNNMYEGQILYQTNKGYIYPEPTESYDDLLSKAIDKKDSIKLDLDKCDKIYISSIEKKIFNEHDFDYPNENFVPVDLDLTDGEIETYVKVKNLICEDMDNIFIVKTDFDRVKKQMDKVKKIFQSRNKFNLSKLNFKSDVKILEVLYETSSWKRN